MPQSPPAIQTPTSNPFRNSIAIRFSATTGEIEHLPFRELSWGVDDIGCMVGAILVERMRTYGKSLLDTRLNRKRMQDGATAMAISKEAIDLLFDVGCGELLAANAALIDQQSDVAIVLLASPGRSHVPTLMAHLAAIPFRKLQDWYQHGCKLQLTTQALVPERCWPTQMKSRSRLNYYLADLETQSQYPNSIAVLRTERGSIADTPIANILIVDRSGKLVSPKREDILVGCTLQAIEKLVQTTGCSIEFRDIYPDELPSAQEVLLTGSIGGVWHARAINEVAISSQGLGTFGHALQSLWKKHCGISFTEQRESDIHNLSE